MAAQDYTSVVQQLYVSYFGRPADYYGLQSFSQALDAMKAPKTFAEVNAAVQADKAGTSALSKLVNSFNSSAESAALYGTDNSQIGIGKFVNAIYQNVLGRDADKAGFDFWVQAITSGTLTKANAAASITQAALTNTSDQGKLDAKTVENKLAVASSFTLNLDTPAEITAFSGDAAAATARALLSSVNNTTNTTTFQTTINTTIENIVASANPGTTYTLTTSVDTLVGTAGNDTFNGTAETLTSLDKIDGAGGKDTLIIQDAASKLNVALPAGVSITNIEKMVVNTAGSLGRFAADATADTAAVTAAVFDVSGVTGLTDFTATAAGAVNVKVANTTNVTATNTGAGNVTVAGGSNVVVTTAAAGAVNVTGAALTSVSVKGGNGVIVNNVDSSAAAGKGTTLTAVTLDGIAGGATVSGASVTSVALNNVASTQTVTVNNATAAHTLNVSANAAGATGTSAAVVTIADAAATTVALTAAGKSNLAVNAAEATKVTVNAADALSLNLAGATKLASVDASASAGGVTLTNLATTVTSVTTGAGGDKVTLTTATKAATATAAAVNATISTGAGNDDITISVTGDGNYTVNAGEGNDTIRVAQNLLTAGNTIDGGAGTDTLVLTNNAGINFAAGDYAVINSLVRNVETLEFVNGVNGVDASKMAFTSLGFKAAGTVTGVSTQALSTSGASLTATAAGHVDGKTYAGNLNVTTTGANSALDLGADAATVNVKASTSNAAATTINGDLQTSLTVNLTNSANASSSPTGDNLSSATVTVNASENTALKSVVLTGAGSVTINASASGALTTIDASKLGGTIANGTTKGDITGGLTFTGNIGIAETITLGSGKDTITVASTYEKMDTIIGFDAVKEGSTGASTTDVLIINASQLVAVGGTAPAAALTLNGAALASGQTSTTGISKLTLTSADSTLDLAFVKAATASAASNGVVSFEFGGNTYLFADTNDNGTLDSSDFAVKLVGSIDVTAGFGVAPTA